jgi:predicted phage tail protein
VAPRAAEGHLDAEVPRHGSLEQRGPIGGRGGRGGLGSILAGVGLVALAFVTGGATIGLLGLAAPVAVSSVLGSLGASLILGGVAQMLSPQPDISALQRGKEAARLESFSFTSDSGTPNADRISSF